MKEKAPYRVVILKRRFPASSRKSIVRTTHISTILTIIDFHVLKDDSQKRFLDAEPKKGVENLPPRL